MSLLIGFLDKLCFRLILTSANLCWIIACSLSKLLCECVWKAFAALDNCCFHFSYVLQFFWNKQIFKINLKLFVRAGEGWPAPTNPSRVPKMVKAAYIGGIEEQGRQRQRRRRHMPLATNWWWRCQQGLDVMWVVGYHYVLIIICTLRCLCQVQENCKTNL